MPASNQIITDLKSAITTGPSATSKANAIAATGPIQDLLGMYELALLKAQELRTLNLAIIAVLDAGDATKAKFTDTNLSLV